MGDPVSAWSNYSQTLRNKFESEKRRLSYTDFHYEDVKARLNMEASPSNQTEKVGNKDEIVRHMSNLPSYLETRKDSKALNFGVMDWEKLQKWQYRNVGKDSPASSHSSPLFSTEKSTPKSTVGQRFSHSGQRPPRVTLQSYFNTSSCSRNVSKPPPFYPPKIQDPGSLTDSATFKGKMKIQDPFFNSEIDEKTRSFEVKRSSFSSKIPNLETGMSPIRRFSFSNIKKPESPVSQKPVSQKPVSQKPESPVSQKPVSQKPVSQKPVSQKPVSTRSQASPLRRLFEPLFQLKSPNSRQFTESPRQDSNSDLKNETCESTPTRQALFQSVIKNGRPLFTFAIENDNNILAATVRDLTSSSGKDNSNHWIYTIFTVDEIKKKNTNWLSYNKKDTNYAPNVTAQMMVTNRSIYNSDTREFSLFRVDPYDEQAAIVVKFSRNEEEDKERFSMMVILPGGNHGVSSNGKPSPLTDRWRSGGVCDCGGWDLGCRLRILSNQVQSSGRSNSPNGRFELFFQGDVTNKKPYFNLCPIKDGIFSVEYNSSITPLQAFSMCISVVECRKSSQFQESTTYVAKRVINDPSPVRFASFPPLSPVGRV